MSRLPEPTPTRPWRTAAYTFDWSNGKAEYGHFFGHIVAVHIPSDRATSVCRDVPATPFQGQRLIGRLRAEHRTIIVREAAGI